MKKYVSLSYALSSETPRYGANPPFEATPHSSLKAGDLSNTYIFNFHNHTGTHLDCPRHFLEEGKTITDYAIEELVFHSPAVIDCPKGPMELVTADDLRACQQRLRGKDLLLLRTGFGCRRGSETYVRENPGVDPDAVSYIRDNFPKIRCLGIDSLSISSFAKRDLGREAHRMAFEMNRYPGPQLLLIEDMKLSDPLDDLCRVFVAPLLVKGIDGAPCTVIGELDISK